MWAGRFSKEVDEKVNDFNSSISFDARMYKYDIEGSIAHATMLGEAGIIDISESRTIIAGTKYGKYIFRYPILFLYVVQTFELKPDDLLQGKAELHFSLLLRVVLN